MPPPIDLAASFDRLDIMKKVMRQRLGDASSSIYLWHFPLIVPSVALGFGALSVVVIFGVGVVSYRYVEAPLQGGVPGDISLRCERSQSEGRHTTLIPTS